MRFGQWINPLLPPLLAPPFPTLPTTFPAPLTGGAVSAALFFGDCNLLRCKSYLANPMDDGRSP